MAKPHEMFSGKAPIAMARMGEGIADAYAKAGAIEGAGMAKMGEAIGSGITSAAQAYAAYKGEKSKLKAQESAMDTFMPFLPREMQDTISAQRETLNKTDTSVADKRNYYDSMLAIGGNAMGQNYKMQQIGAEQGAATTRTGMSEAGANVRNAASNETQLENSRLQGLFNSINSPNMINMQKSSFAPAPFGISTQMGGGLYQAR